VLGAVDPITNLIAIDRFSYKAWSVTDWSFLNLLEFDLGGFHVSLVSDGGGDKE